MRGRLGFDSFLGDNTNKKIISRNNYKKNSNGKKPTAKAAAYNIRLRFSNLIVRDILNRMVERGVGAGVA